jgi:hypothetical protein
MKLDVVEMEEHDLSFLGQKSSWRKRGAVEYSPGFREPNVSS